MKVSMLSTVDNPYDPFDDWDDWYRFDEGEKNNLVHQFFGFGCCELIDKESFAVSEMPFTIANDENERAIDEILKIYGDLGIFKKVSKEI